MPEDDPTGLGRRQLARRTLWLGLGSVALAVIIGVDVFFIVRHREQAGAVAGASATVSGRAPVPPVSSAPVPPVASVTAPSSSAAPPALPDAEPTALPSAPPPSALSTASGDAPFDDENDPSLEPAKPAPPKHFATVHEAAVGSCSTVSVEGLSKQIIEQARCISPNAVVRLPERPNLVLGPHVFPYLEAGASAHLMKALAARPKATLTVNSALRTLAQQYLVWRWSQNQRCGVQLATPPGDSNHELGLALDIADHAAWKGTLEAQSFRWLGASDLVHFDFEGSKGPPKKSVDVLAFQKLWNRNHPKELLPETGRYDAATELRLKTAPADGFAAAPTCGKARVSATPAKPAARPAGRDAR